MWKCSACGNENKDEYRFCLSCGNPRPSKTVKRPEEKKAPSRKSRKSGVVTAVLLIISLLLILAIVALIVFFPKLSGKQYDAREEETETGTVHRSGSAKSGEEEESGGISSFIFGGETTHESAASTFAPASPAQQDPVLSAEPSPEPTPAPTAAPVSDGEFLIPGSDSRYITDDDLKDLSWEQCCLARNEIFARHGRIFVTKEIASYFNSKSWYSGTVSAAAFSDTVLNEYEKANVNFISQYETKHWGGSYY